MSNNYVELRGLRRSDATMADRCAERLLAMRKDLEPLRQRRRDGTLLLATWNIRDFDSNKFKFGPRLAETFFYIAEIISCFDLVAVQEVNQDLSALERVMRLLGRRWDYIATDTTEGRGGNGERMAFVYNTDKVWFRKIAGEVVLPEGQLVVSQEKRTSDEPQVIGPVATAVESGFGEVRQQFARTPFVVAFQSGWFRFNLCTVHIYFGSDTGAQLKRRISEIERLVHFFASRQDRENRSAGTDPGKLENYILLGDFNVVSPEHKTAAALRGEGFTIPPQIDGTKIRTEEDHFYDQIAVRVMDPRFKVVTGGLVDMYQSVFRDTAGDRRLYDSFMPAEDPEADPQFRASSRAALYRKWRTWQMSDHRPLWIEVETDFADHYLEGFVHPAG